MSLFKYLPLARVDVLTNLKIRFSQVSSLNDPYEVYHSLDIKPVIDKVIEEGENECHNHWATLTELEKKEQENEYLETINNIKEAGRSEIDNALMSTEMSRILDKHLGILSLSRSNVNLLMWSHYAESSQGFVIEFDSEHDFFYKRDSVGLRTAPIVVKYSDRRPILKNGSECSNQEALGVKPIDWSYEQEERITINFLGLKPSINNEKNMPVIDDFGNKIYLVDIPKDAINAIYFGPRMPEKSKKDITNSIEKNNINCKLYESRMAKGQYRIEFNEIKA